MPASGPGFGGSTRRWYSPGRRLSRESGRGQIQAAGVELAFPDPFHEVAIDDDRAPGLLDDVGADAEHDRGIGERHHRVAGAEGGQRILAEPAVKPAGDEVAARAQDEPMCRGRDAQGAVAPRPACADEGELAAADEDLRDDHRAALREPLGERVDEYELLVGIEHVRESGAIEPDTTRESLAGRVRDEVDLGQVGCLDGARAHGRPGLPKDEPKSRADRADHKEGRMRRRTTAVRGTKVPAPTTAIVQDSVMQPRPIDPKHDLQAVVDLLGQTRASGGLTHPGGIQWWLRELVRQDRNDFAAYVWADEAGAFGAFALVDGEFVVQERIDGGPTTIEQIGWLEAQLRGSGRQAIEFHVAQGDPIRDGLLGGGYQQSGIELELLADTSHEPEREPLPAGLRFGSLLDVSDDAYIDGHRAAWSDRRPSPYRRELHDAVKRMPGFRPDLVTIAIAPDGTVAACCIGWMDQRSATLEIEPLGTHRDYRRLGIAHAVVKEVQHRAWENGARHVLVWNDPNTNPAAYRLYTGADMPPNRTLIALRKELSAPLVS
jgi:ribosomal protein S18 acetylase RimI-like enzyme